MITLAAFLGNEDAFFTLSSHIQILFNLETVKGMIVHLQQVRLI